MRLTNRQVEALAGVYCRETVRAQEDERGNREGWEAGVDAVLEAAGSAALRERLHGDDVDRLLLEEGLAADEESRGRLLEAMNRAFMDAAAQLKRMPEGVYAPDPAAERFPTLPAPRAQAAAPRSGEG